jgi:curved DNA-binding protein CbpA
MPRSGDAIFGWVHVLDRLSYYELFGIASEASCDEVREAFCEFCDTFHPDRHVARPHDERQAVLKIFKRGTEAYVVLGDRALRARYDTQLTASSDAIPQRLPFLPLSRPLSDASPRTATLEDVSRSLAARPFARRADELMGKGDLRQAKLQLVLANHRDPGNPGLESALRDLTAKLAGGDRRPPDDAP